MPFKKNAFLFYPILLLLISTPFFVNIKKNDFHPDENLWIKMSLYFDTVFLNGKLEDLSVVTFRSIDQPAFGKYIFGSIQTLLGGKNTLIRISQIPLWDFNLNDAKNISLGAIPPPDILLRARSTAMLFGVLCCLATFWVGTKIFGLFIGSLAALILAYNPLMLICSCRAMTDAPLLFFMALVPLVTVIFFGFLQNKKWILAFVASVLIGIIVGIAAGTKLNGAISGFVFAFFCLEIIILEILKTVKSIKRADLIKSLIHSKVIQTSVVSSLTAGVVSFSIFILLNPLFYPNPFQSTLHMIAHRLNVAKRQQTSVPKAALKTPKAKLFFVVQNSLVNSSNSTFFKYLKFSPEIVFFVIGILYLCFNEFKGILATASPSLSSLMMTWTLVTYVGTILWIPMNWGRYYLPVFPTVSVIVALGIYASCQIGKKIIHQTVSPRVFH